MVLLYSDPAFLRHETGDHPECADRLRHITAHLESSGLAAQCLRPTWERITPDRLALVHRPEYAAAVKSFAERHPGRRIESDTVVSRDSYDVALLAAGAVCDAVERVVRGEEKRALCLVRPPGHHALPAGAMGFCLFNNIALGAALATQVLGLDRVLIVDWDVHHGNGTQDAFWEDERVGFYSIHRWPFYPGTGNADETGTGPGLGATVNVPIEMGVSRARYFDKLRLTLEHFAGKLRPNLVLISAGFDAHREDPVGSLGLDTEDFASLTTSVLDVAEAFAGGKVVSVLEGGYNPPRLAESVGLHLQGLIERP